MCVNRLEIRILPVQSSATHTSNIMKSILLLLLAIASLSAAPSSPEVSVIPKPKSITQLNGSPHQLNGQTRILYRGKDAVAVAELLAEALRSQTSLSLKVSELKGDSKNSISLVVSESAKDKNPESYALKSASGKTEILAPTSRGLFNATQTLLLLIPDGKKAVTSVTVVDAPSYKWRGMMLDVSRYFFN